MKITLSTLTSALLALSPSERRQMFVKVFRELPDREKKKLWEAVTFTMYDRARWLKIDGWMEKMFFKDYTLTPYRVAMMALRYFRLDRRMKPLMITLARRIKKRVRYKLKGNKTSSELK